MGFLAQVDPLIRDLGSEDYDVRERATAALLERGRQAVPALVRAAEASADPEVRTRCERILDRVLSVRVAVSVEPGTNRLRIRIVNEKRRSVPIDLVPRCTGNPYRREVEVDIVDPNGRAVPLRRDPPREPSFRAAGELSAVVWLKPGSSIGPYVPPASGITFDFCDVPDGLTLEVPGTYAVRCSFNLGFDLCIDSGWLELKVPPPSQDTSHKSQGTSHKAQVTRP